MCAQSIQGILDRVRKHSDPLADFYTKAIRLLDETFPEAQILPRLFVQERGESDSLVFHIQVTQRELVVFDFCDRNLVWRHRYKNGKRFVEEAGAYAILIDGSPEIDSRTAYQALTEYINGRCDTFVRYDYKHFLNLHHYERGWLAEVRAKEQ